MLQLSSTMPFHSKMAVLPNEKGIDTLYITVKATFLMNESTDIAEEQIPINLTDEYWGEEGLSSIKNVSELHLKKPTSDIIMTGDASAPDRRKVQELDVNLRVGKINKTIRVFGDREWVPGIVGLRKSSPVPFETMPMIYERAYGGIHEINSKKEMVVFEPRNPVGKGFKGKKTKKEMKGSPLPNLEDPVCLIRKPKDTPVPVCYGYTAPNWEPRMKYAGTYDEEWKKSRAPYLPDDFSPRFFNSAHPDLIADGYLQGGELVKITNMSPDGPQKFNLPICEFISDVFVEKEKKSIEMKMETLLLKPNERLFCIVWRGEMESNKKALKIKQVNLALNKIVTGGK